MSSILSDRDKLLRTALLLLGFSIAYNFLEAIIAIWFGKVADSIALIGFGVDSIIETSASFLLIWRFRKEKQGMSEEELERVEHFAHRFVGITFFILAAYIAYKSATALWFHEAPDQSTAGMVIAALSLLIMPSLALAKMRVADKMSSPALRAEAKETIACSILSLILLVGLALNALFGWWWADPVAALLMLPWLIQEGKEGLKLKGEGCCG